MALSKQVPVPVHVRGDASVIYKFLNPNLLTLITESSIAEERVDGDFSSQASINVYMLNAVSGQIVHQSRINGAVGPVQFLAYENWCLVHYWNTTKNRFEIYVVDLFEGRQDDGKGPA